MELRFGDTGTLNDERWGEHTLGALICDGDGEYLHLSQNNGLVISVIYIHYILCLDN